MDQHREGVRVAARLLTLRWEVREGIEDVPDDDYHKRRNTTG
jgi:hypothetical protein